eukprot:m.549486 g.549486  ORF g.549486 m.549486 type:complete len:699 (+) comp22160_c0_seq12:216-2312(+)
MFVEPMDVPYAQVAPAYYYQVAFPYVTRASTIENGYDAMQPLALAQGQYVGHMASPSGTIGVVPHNHQMIALAHDPQYLHYAMPQTVQAIPAVTYTASTIGAAVVANPTTGTASTGTNSQSPSSYSADVASALVVSSLASPSTLTPAGATTSTASGINHVIPLSATQQQHAFMYQHVPYDQHYQAIHPSQHVQWAAIQQSVAVAGNISAHSEKKRKNSLRKSTSEASSVATSGTEGSRPREVVSVVKNRKATPRQLSHANNQEISTESDHNPTDTHDGDTTASATGAMRIARNDQQMSTETSNEFNKDDSVATSKAIESPVTAEDVQVLGTCRRAATTDALPVSSPVNTNPPSPCDLSHQKSPVDADDAIAQPFDDALEAAKIKIMSMGFESSVSEPMQLKTQKYSRKPQYARNDMKRVANSPCATGASLSVKSVLNDRQNEGDAHHADSWLDVTKFNPDTFICDPAGARFYVIKCFSESDIYNSIKTGLWTSTERGYVKLSKALNESQRQARDSPSRSEDEEEQNDDAPKQRAPIYLFFSVNGSGHFCGVAELMSCDAAGRLSPANQNEQQHETCESNQVQVRWHFVKDIPNVEFKHIRNPWNDNKPIPQSGDTQEVPFAQGSALLRVIAQYRAEYSIFDSLIDYESTEEDRKPAAKTKNQWFKPYIRRHAGYGTKKRHGPIRAEKSHRADHMPSAA